MSELPDKESTAPTQDPAPCPRCGKPFLKSTRFSVSSLFQTDPGEGLSRWQTCCKCDAPPDAVDNDLPFLNSGEVDQDGFSSSSQNWQAPYIRTQAEADAEAQARAASTAAEFDRHDGAPDDGSNLHDSSDNSFSAGVLLNSSAHDTANGAPTNEGGFSLSGWANQASSGPKALPGATPSVTGVNTPDSRSGEPPSSDPRKRSADASATNLPPSGASQSYMIGARYEVESVIGKGTFGPTYRARDVATNKSLCLKMVSTPISRHRRIVKRIMQEVEKAKTLNHPNIVAIYDSSIDKTGRPFYVMDLIEPGSLKQVIRQEGFLDVPEVLDIFLDVCEALLYAHEHGILHRDLKPGNILLSDAGTTRRAKVCDFGIIKALPSVGSEAQEMTQSSDVFADPSCMSPEQCLGRRLDVRSDIYSLGCSMYEAIIGKKVFTGPNPLSIVVQHFKSAPRPFDAVMYNCDIPQDVEAVVLKMLEKSPEHRYQEISQVIEDLRSLKAHKKPNFAYQKKKGGVRNLMLPFGVKDEPDSPEKMFDLVINRRNLQIEDKHDWDEDPRKQIAKDINRIVRKPNDRKPGAYVELVSDGKSPDKIIARADLRRVDVGPPPNAHPEPGWVKEVKNKNAEEQVIRPGKLKLPLPVEGTPAVPVRSLVSDTEIEEGPLSEQRVLRKMAPVYRASDSYPENLEEMQAVSLFGKDFDDEIDAPIVTVEQAKREIPDYLLQISNRSGFVSFPILIACVTAITLIVILMQIAALSHP